MRLFALFAAALRKIRLDPTRNAAISERSAAATITGCSGHLGITQTYLWEDLSNMSPSNAELQRLLRLLGETATKAEQEAYAAGWRDCRAALLKAVSSVGDKPQGTNGIYTAMSETNGTAESAYAN